MSQIYFIQAGNFVKIGRSASPKDRLANLSTGIPEQLTILATMCGGSAIEAALHRAFITDQTKGEWFQLSERLVEFINELRGGHPPILIQEVIYKVVPLWDYPEPLLDDVERRKLPKIFKSLKNNNGRMIFRDLYRKVACTAPQLKKMVTISPFLEIEEDKSSTWVVLKRDVAENALP